jgi:TPR repeat protein
MRHPEHPKQRPATHPVIRVLASLATVAVMTAARGAGVPAAQEVDWLSQLAHQGDAGAQLQLGLAYRDGRYGVTPDRGAARYWLEAAAHGGYAYAAEAERELDGSSAAAKPQANANAFAALVERLDLPGLNALSALWHVVAAGSSWTYSRDALLARAEQGDALAEYQLGLRYRNGAWAVEPDARQSRVWLQRSAADGDRLATQALTKTRNF